MKRLLKSKKGNALVLILVVLTMLAAFGLSHLIMSRTGIRQSRVLFAGIDANLLLEGLVSQAENQIRQQANAYDKTPEWFNTFRDTNIGGESGFKEIDLSGTPIKAIADSGGYEIKVVAQFIANSRVYAYRSGGVEEDITLEGGKEKWGQLEIKAQVKIGDNYYHAHAAKDVKVINPLTLSHDGQFNGLHKYNMYIKYAYNEYDHQYAFPTGGGTAQTPAIRCGNYIYNRYTDEETDPDNNKIGNNYYFVRLDNGVDDNKGKVYLGASRDKRNIDNKILIDLPRRGYGGFYTEQIKKYVHTIGYEKKDPKNPSDMYNDEWLRITYEVEVPGAFGSDWETESEWLEVNVCENTEHMIMKSALGPRLDKTWEKIKEEYKNAYEKDGTRRNARITFPTDGTSRDGELVKYMVATGISAGGGEPVIEKTVTGFEYVPQPWEITLDGPGWATKSTETDDDGRQKKNSFMVNLPPNHKLADSMTNPLGLGRLTTVMNYPLYFQFNGQVNGDDMNRYNSLSHSSFIDNNAMARALNGTDSNDGFRGHPPLQLRGIWANGGWTSDTEIEGNIWARYLETYYMVMKDKDDKGDFTGLYSYLGLGAFDYDGKDITGYNGDKLFDIPFENIAGLKGLNIDRGLLNIVQQIVTTGTEEQKDNMKWDSCYGPAIRNQITNDPQAETLRSVDPNNNNGYNSRAIFVPYNGKNNPAPISQTGDTIRADPDFANVYLDKVTAVFTNFKEFSEKNMKFDGEKLILYLNGIYMINSFDKVNLPGLPVKEIEYVGKGALLFAGNVVISCDLVPQDEDHDLLILATIGRRNEDGSLGSSSIGFLGPDDEPLEIKASIVAMNRDFIDSGENLGLIKPCVFTFGYGANIYGQWASDWFYYYPNGEDGINENLKGTNVKYDPRFFESHAGDSEYYLADIGLPFSFWKVWKNKDSEI